jgi:hypothetical protein
MKLPIAIPYVSHHPDFFLGFEPEGDHVQNIGTIYWKGIVVGHFWVLSDKMYLDPQMPKHIQDRYGKIAFNNGGVLISFENSHNVPSPFEDVKEMIDYLAECANK